LTSRLRRVQKWFWSRRPCHVDGVFNFLSIDFFWFFKVNFLEICPSKIKILIWKLKGKWHFGATFIDNEGKNVIGCIYLMNITGARGTDHPPFSNFLLTILFSIKFLWWTYQFLIHRINKRSAVNFIYKYMYKVLINRKEVLINE
jgi:hypothetical protein